MASVTDDPRFASMHTAPVCKAIGQQGPAALKLKHIMVNAPTPWTKKLQTFQRIPKDERRFKIDPRFKAVLTDDRFRAVDGAYRGCGGTYVCAGVCGMPSS